MPPINVFISYVDTFVGKRVLRQFQQFPATYRVYGCTWDSDAAEQLNATAAAAAVAAAQAQAAQTSGLHGGANTHHGSGTATEFTDDGDRSLLHDSRGTLTPCDMSQADTMPLVDHDGPGGNTSHPHPHHDSHARPGTLSSTKNGGAGGGVGDRVSASATFFSRHDVAAARAALLACDWIILELRQAQTVLEVVQFLQQQPSFARPKRLVLLSSLMTWYATPALRAATADDAADSGLAEAEDDEDEAAQEQQQHDGDAEGDVAAPYPPPPPLSLERLLRSAQNDARHAVVDAMRGGVTSADGDGSAAAGGLLSDGEADNEDDAGGAAKSGEEVGDAAAAAAAEVLTEDQYNRRVPHLHYMSWRDAEKAVAAAHHAKGLPLDTFVVCSGLPFGGEEDALEPLFRLAWSAQPEKADKKATAVAATLPIFGDGRQRVPLVHVQDLACFVRKLLRCPTANLPFPERRYLFATDGSNVNSWSAIAAGVNRMFGGRCALQPVAPASYPLYRDVDKFTINLRVEAETMKALMERQDDAGGNEGLAAAAEVAADPSSVHGGVEAVPLPNTWVAEGGLRRHLRAVADEFAAARGVTPLRLALVGPPLSGKTFLATRLAHFYRLPCVSLDSVVAEYKGALQALRARMDSTKAAVLQAERARRLAIKRRRVVARQQREWDADDAAADVSAAAAATTMMGDADDDDGDSVGTDIGAQSHTVAGGGHPPTLHPTVNGVAATQHEVSPSAFELTPQEEEELGRFVQEWWADQPQVQAWVNKVGEMERVLLLRLHPRPPTPDANPKKRAAGGGGGGGGGKKKGNAGKDAQKSKEEEEELQQLKAMLQTAPFQTRALALMLRWRLAQPDCRVQGFVLDGVPTTLELARLLFSDDAEESMQPPATEEEALKPRYIGEPSSGAAAGSDGAEGGDGGGAASSGGAGPRGGKEVASEERLPEHVVVLQASDTFLLSRLRSMGAAAEQQMAGAPAVESTHAVSVESFQRDMQTYKREYEEAPYSVLSYFECAAAAITSSPAAAAAAGAAGLGKERRAEVHLVTVDGHEPLVPAPPPASAFAEVPAGDTELLLQQAIIGRPHNFGKSLEELQRDAVRRRCLQEEEARAQADLVAAQAAAETSECAQEADARAEEDAALAELKKADLAELEARKQPMTRYLQERVLPLLHKGLLEVCATRPQDPVDFLAEWLLRHNPHDDTFSDI